MLYGALNEISGVTGTGKTEAILRFLAENSNDRVAWIEDKLTVYPCALPNHGVALDRMLFVEAGRELEWASLQVLASRAFRIVIISISADSRPLGELQLRRLQLAAEQANASVILLTEKPTTEGRWPIAYQALAGRKPAAAPEQLDEYQPILKIIKKRHAWKAQTS